MATLVSIFQIFIMFIIFHRRCDGESGWYTCIPEDNIAKGNPSTRVYHGFNFLTRTEWKANNWNYQTCSCDVNDSDTTEIIPLSKPYVITIHHTEIPTQSVSLNDSINKVQQIQEFHQDTRKWCDIAYNFLIDSAGNIFQGRPFWDDFNSTYVWPLNKTRIWPSPRLIQGAHSINSNENNIGIAVIGCYDSNATNCPNGTDSIRRYDATYTRLVQLISWLCAYYDISPSNSTIVRHKHWRMTDCPGNILGGKQMFNDIIIDVQKGINDGTGLCYDYSNNIINGTGGICINSQLCNDNDLVIDTGDEDQCRDFGQVCCEIEPDNGGKGNSNKDWGAVYIVIAIVTFVIIIGIIAFILKKRKEWLLDQSKYADLTEDIPIDVEQ